MSVPYAFKKNHYIPQVIYLFIRKVFGDYVIHFNFFIEDMKNYELELDNINIIMYNNIKLGHSPISKEASIAYINTYLTEQYLWI